MCEGPVAPDRIEISDVRHLIERPVFLELVIRNAILNALAWTNGNQAEAAGLLGISSRSINFKMRAYGIPRGAQASTKGRHFKRRG